MSLLVVGGVTVSVANTDQDVQFEPIGGEVVRMFDGSARTTVRAYKRTWMITTIILPDATAATLKAVLISTTQPVTCSGDLFGTSLSCITQLTSYAAVNVRGALYRRVAFKLIEV